MLWISGISFKPSAPVSARAGGSDTSANGAGLADQALLTAARLGLVAHSAGSIG